MFLSQPCFFISFWLWFVLSYMTQQDGLVGRQDGRMAGIQVRIMIPPLPVTPEWFCFSTSDGLYLLRIASFSLIEV